MLILIGSLFGAAYFGYKGLSFYVVIGWAIFCALWFMKQNKELLEQARQNAYGEKSDPNIGSRLTSFLIFIAIAAVLCGVQLGAYYIASFF